MAWIASSPDKSCHRKLENPHGSLRVPQALALLIASIQFRVSAISIMTTRHPFPFRWVLPVAQLWVCFVLLLPELEFLGFQMHSAANAYWPQKVDDPVAHLNSKVVVVDSDMPPPTMRIEKIRVSLPAVINLPSSFIGLSAWVPKGMLPDFWRAISFPLVGVIFWFVAGRSIEALSAARSRSLSPVITWVEFGTALMIVISCALFCVGLVVDPSIREDLVFPWLPAFVASVGWALLGATTVSGRIIQWQIRRRSTLASDTETPA